ncbi:MAG: protein kinase domain-containing protein [Gemmatimonadales bacterium]
MSENAELQEGLSGRYLLERELGRGGTAVVWLARDLKHDRPVALKLLHPTLANSLGPERFSREIRFAARLQHPHILTVLDSGETAGRLWFTMPFVEGETLRARLRREGRLSLDEALRITRESAHALQHAHDHDVVHRDVKPENILLTRDGSTLVADFGIARALTPIDAVAVTTLTEAGLVVGTPSYMSPEQVAGARDLDGRSDVYALGCVLYEMLAGTPPFSGPSPQAVAMRHLAEPAPDVTAANPAVPPTIAAAIARTLAKRPAERFVSPMAFVAALESGREQPGAGGSSRKATLIIAGALAAAVALGYGARELRRGPDTASAAVASGFNRRMAQLTSREGIEEWPAWSSDGTRLAFSAEMDGYLQLIVRTMASGEDRQLTRGPRDHIQPAWSADGRRLAFVRARSERGKLSPSDIYGWYYENGDIWAMDLEGGNATPLVDDAFSPAFSPDGASLAFDAPWAGPRRVWVADVRGRNPRQVTSDSSDAVVHTQPKWSPDGTRLLYRRVEKTQSDIALVDVGSQAAARLTADAVLDTDPTWSPDGRSVYFTSARGGGMNLWRLPLSEPGRPAGPPQQLTTGAGDDIQPAIGPRGQVAFAVRGINSDLWRLPVSPETGAPTGDPEPVAAGTRVESRGAWSPDGSAIAFNSDRLGEMNIWVRTLAAGTDRQLTTGVGGDYQPQWSPDGARLVFFSAREGNNDIWTAELADGKLVRLTSDPAMEINPFYSPDGSRVAFMSDRSGRFEVWLMRADGSDRRQLTTVGAWGHFLRWTRDGSGIVFRADDWSQVRIFRVGVAGATLSELPPVESGGHMSLSPSESLALDVRGHRTLRAHPLDGRPAYQVFEFANPDVRIDYPVWSPDGHWVLFDRAEPRGGDLWILSEQ